MVFCAKCGETIPENANFCPECGVKTSKGKEANISPPWDDVFSEVGEAIKNALSIAGSEIEKAFKTAKEGIRNATTKEYVVCSNCGEKNRTEAQFCHICGKSLA